MTEDPRAPELEATIEIDAAPERVWALISDIERMSSWSPQVVRSTVDGDTVGLGTTFTNDNQHDDVAWPTNARVERFEPPREFAFKVKENRLIWSFQLEPLPGGGTRVTERREAPDGITDLSIRFTEKYLDGVEAFTERQRAGMRETLERLKAEAEA
jgi:uncharacterized protein YndB with AHSA1/START domain